MAGSSSGVSDAAIVAEARQLYASPLMQQIRKAHQRGEPDLVKIGKWTVQYENLAFSGMTAFPSGFVIGKEAFASEDEFKKTLLHELYRLCRSDIGRGGDADPVTIKAERDEAFWFAERNYIMI